MPITNVAPERAGEIALRLIRYKMVKTGISDGLHRELGNVAKHIDISQEELHCFLLQHIIPGVISKALGNAEATMEIKPFSAGYGDPS